MSDKESLEKVREWTNARSRLPVAQPSIEDYLDITDDGKVVVRSFTKPVAQPIQPQLSEKFMREVAAEGIEPIAVGGLVAQPERMIPDEECLPKYFKEDEPQKAQEVEVELMRPEYTTEDFILNYMTALEQRNAKLTQENQRLTGELDRLAQAYAKLEEEWRAK